MNKICCLDSDDCLTLESISEAFRCGIKEEHSWAIIYQSIISLNEYLSENNGNTFTEPNQLFIRSNGTVHPKTWCNPSDVPKHINLRKIPPFITKSVYKALDFGTSEDEEMIVPTYLEEVLVLMFDIISHQNVDEGIEESDDSEIMSALNKVEEKCVNRINDNMNVADHYRNVCRALVAEAIEMSTFLNQISKGTQELSRMKNVNNEEVEHIHVEVWAHLWMKVMRQLRSGVSLKTTDKNEFINIKQKEYELTPFEMLLDDINSKRYSLKKVSLPKQVEKDARTVILDFIRSRPPLKPVSNRILSPPKIAEACLHEKLMSDIKQTHNLRPTPPPFERKFDSCHMPRGKRLTTFSIYSKNVVVTPVSHTSDGTFQRLSFRNLSLRKSYPTFNFSPKYNTPIEGSLVSTPSTLPFWRKLFKFW